MPTGYTGPALDNRWTVRQYAERCARAMGCFAAYRDEPMDMPLPKKTPDWVYDSAKSYRDSIKEQTEKLNKLLAMTEKEQAEYGEKKKIESLESDRASLKKVEDELGYFKDLLKQVEDEFEVPEELIGWKEFMVSQLTSTISHHDMTDYYSRSIKEMEKQSPQEIYESDVKFAKESIERYKERLAEEEERKTKEPGHQHYIDLIHETLAKYE